MLIWSVNYVRFAGSSFQSKKAIAGGSADSILFNRNCIAGKLIISLKQ